MRRRAMLIDSEAGGLLGAGSLAAVVSLSPMDDASNSLLMAAFYRALRTGCGPADALRKAQTHLGALERRSAAGELAGLRTTIPAGARDMLDRQGPVPAAGHDHPYHWARFALVGTGIAGKEDS
jgi:CHAT domain-containing protein